MRRDEKSEDEKERVRNEVKGLLLKGLEVDLY